MPPWDGCGRTEEGGIDQTRVIAGPHEDHALIAGATVHLLEQSVDHAAPPVVSLAALDPRADGIQLVDKQERGQNILQQRQRIKRQIIQARRLLHHQKAA